MHQSSCGGNVEPGNGDWNLGRLRRTSSCWRRPSSAQAGIAPPSATLQRGAATTSRSATRGQITWTKKRGTASEDAPGESGQPDRPAPLSWRRLR